MSFQNFPFGPTTPLHEATSQVQVKRTATSPLGPLSLLSGTWVGTGFNQIWRPFDLTANPPGHDHFLELNLTSEQLVFTVIGTGTPPGEIANRGLLQPDIPLFGVTY